MREPGHEGDGSRQSSGRGAGSDRLRGFLVSVPMNAGSLSVRCAPLGPSRRTQDHPRAVVEPRDHRPCARPLVSLRGGGPGPSSYRRFWSPFRPALPVLPMIPSIAAA